ncbi:nitroreductase family protein [Streptomyces sp. NPDC006976]|uniref:nitroreductase family protein n=1 Tax=Streptomyces sp. NPDC006976 TaxID=3154311 RepID=UPI0033E42D6F
MNVPEAPAPDRAGPVPEDADTMARDRMWYLFAAGADRPAEPPMPPDAEPPPGVPVSALPVAPRLPGTARFDDLTALPPGTVDLLEDAPFPAGRITGVPEDRALAHALVAAFGVQRREPENPFNDHRGYASVRAKFPVQVLVNDRGRRQVFDPYRRALAGLSGASSAPSAAREVLLTGRFTRLPATYRWYRGSLVQLELGIALRALCVALELLGIPARVRFPGPGARQRLAEFGLTPSWEWTLPVVVELAGDASAGPAGPDHGPAEAVPDRVMADVVEMNRAQDFPAAASPVDTAIASTAPDTGRSWAEVLWQRTSGRMPRGLFGNNARPRTVPGEVLDTARDWLLTPPPGAGPRAAAGALRVTAVTQSVTGHPDGVYEVTPSAYTPRATGPGVPARLEEIYGYPLAPGNGCDVRHASVLWFLSFRPRELAAHLGTSGWTAAQYACGWAVHGLTLAAASAGLYARPVRAFREAPARRILGLPSDEMVVLAVISGTSRFSGPLLDLRQ